MTQKTSVAKVKAPQKRGRPITWAQVNLEAAKGLAGLVSRHPVAAQLVLTLIQHMKPGAGGVVVVSRNTMAELLEVSLSSVERALRVLIDEGWVQRIRIGGAPALAINHRVAWIGPRGDLPHAVFGATVIASRSEQDDLALNPPPMRSVPAVAQDEPVVMEEEDLDLNDLTTTARPGFQSGKTVKHAQGNTDVARALHSF